MTELLEGADPLQFGYPPGPKVRRVQAQVDERVIPSDPDAVRRGPQHARRASGDRVGTQTASLVLDGGSGGAPLERRWGALRRRLGGLAFVATTPEQAAEDLVAAAIEGGTGQHVHLANAYSVAMSERLAADGRSPFTGEAWNLPDGRPVSVLGRRRGPLPAMRQVRGPQFFLDACSVGVAHGVRHYLLGAAPEVLDRLVAELRQRFPGIRIVGADSPPFREATVDELRRRDRAIRDSGAQIVWVGLGTPKQDTEVARIAARVPVLAVAVGAAFDYAAGTLREAPAWTTRFGVEWLFRLAVEPRRLWRRYLFGNLRFLVAVLRHPRE